MSSQTVIPVTVAAFGPSAAAVFDRRIFEGPWFEDQDGNVPWDERERVELEADPAETLASVIDRAAERFGLSVPMTEWGPSGSVSEVIDGVAFYRPQDDEPYGEPYPFMKLFACVGVDGDLSWQPIERAAMGDLIRAYKRGLLPGDPRRIYLWPIIPQGGEFFFGSWTLLVEGLGIFFRIIEGIAAAYDTSQAVQAVRRRLSRGASVSNAVGDFGSRNIGPSQLTELLERQRSLTIEDLVTLLQVPREEVEGLAAALGAAIDGNGRVGRGHEPDAAFQRALIGFLVQSGNDIRSAPEERIEQFARRRLEALARGETEPYVVWMRDWSDLSRPDREVTGYESEPESGEEEKYILQFRVIAIPIDQGLDPQDIEDRLNAAAGEHYEEVATILDQPLAAGGRGHIIVLRRYVPE